MKTLYWVLGGLAAAAGTGAVVYFVTRKPSDAGTATFSRTLSTSGNRSGGGGYTPPSIAEAGGRMLSLAQVLAQGQPQPSDQPPPGAPLPQQGQSQEDYLKDVGNFMVSAVADLKTASEILNTIGDIYQQLNHFLITNMNYGLPHLADIPVIGQYLGSLNLPF